MLEEPADPSDDEGLKRGFRFIALFVAPEVQALLKANARQERRLAVIRSLMTTGGLPQPVEPHDCSDLYDARRWLREVSQRSEEFVYDMGYDVPTRPQGRPRQDYLDEFWRDNPGYAGKNSFGDEDDFSYLNKVTLAAITKRDLV